MPASLVDFLHHGDRIVRMEQIRTLVCKLQLTQAQRQHVAETITAFAKACQYIQDTLSPNIRNKDRMQTLVYRDVRDRFGLSANLAIRAIERVSANHKAAHATGEMVKQFAASSMDYDQRIFSFWERDWTVSLTLLHGRERFPLALGNYQRGKLTGQQPTSAQLCQPQDGQYCLHIQVKSMPPTPQDPTDVLGVDLGRTDIAHTSDDEAWDGTEIRQCRDHFAHMRTALQHKASKGTRSTRRRCRQLLARLSGRERRFQRHTDHCISKHLVQSANETHAALALEDLTGIRQHTYRQRRSRTERRRGNSWAFYQLRQFLVYKAQAARVRVYLVPPAYTSHVCHRCLHIGSRAGKRFTCDNPTCGWTGDADLNGARNIRTLGQQVGLACGPWVHCRLDVPAGLLKAQAL